MNVIIFKWIGSFKTGKVSTKYETLFPIFILCQSWKNLFIWIWLRSTIVYFIFVHNLVKKIYIKMTQNWKNAKISKNNFFMNFSNIFMWVIVGENTSLGSVLDTILWSENSCGKKPPSFWTSHKFTHVLMELLTFSRYFRTFGQHVLTKIFMWKKSPNLPLHNANFEIFISCIFLRYLQFHVQIPLDPI